MLVDLSNGFGFINLLPVLSSEFINLETFIKQVIENAQDFKEALRMQQQTESDEDQRQIYKDVEGEMNDIIKELGEIS